MELREQANDETRMDDSTRACHNLDLRTVLARGNAEPGGSGGDDGVLQDQRLGSDDGAVTDHDARHQDALLTDETVLAM